MKQGTFCVVSPIREGGAFHQMLEELRRRLEGEGIPFTTPKIGNHVTFIPPFRGTEVEMSWLTAGLECVRIFFPPNNSVRCLQGITTDLFTSKKEDALVVRLDADHDIRDFVERFRSMVPKHTEWLYSPESYLVNFHATAAEGEGLAGLINKKELTIKTTRGLSLFQDIKVATPLHLEPPQLFEKINGVWQPWRM